MAQTGGNGERLELKVGSKSLGIMVKDLVNVFFVVGVLAGAWLAVQRLSAGQERGVVVLTKIYDQQHAGQAKLLELFLTKFQEMLDTMGRQNVLVNDQTTELRQSVEALAKDMNERLETLNWNMRHEPAQHLPLGRRPPDR